MLFRISKYRHIRAYEIFSYVHEVMLQFCALVRKSCKCTQPIHVQIQYDRIRSRIYQTNIHNQHISTIHQSTVTSQILSRAEHLKYSTTISMFGFKSFKKLLSQDDILPYDSSMHFQFCRILSKPHRCSLHFVRVQTLYVQTQFFDYGLCSHRINKHRQFHLHSIYASDLLLLKQIFKKTP